MVKPYTLYGSRISLYTGKLRSYLTYKEIPYEEVLSSMAVYKRIILPQIGVRIIPVIKTPENEYLQDTTVIIDELESRFPDRSVMPQSPKQLLVSKLFEHYGDEWLLLPAMHYRWNKGQEHYIYSNFGATFKPGWPGFIQRYLGKKVGSRFRAFVPMLGINDDSIPALENWYENEFLPALDAHFAEHDYLLGGAASIGDFGLMGPLYAHLFLDPSPGELMRRTAPNVAKWVERMNLPPAAEGQFLEGDAIPATLTPILKQLFSEFWPTLLETVKQTSQWKQSNAGVEIPRSVGKLKFSLGESVAERMVTPFSQWKLQRTLQTYRGLEGSAKQEADNWLTQMGVWEDFQLQINDPLTRVNNVLVWDE